MKFSSQGKQLSIDLFRSSLDGLSKPNRWVQLGDSLPWDDMKLYTYRLNNGKRGAGNKPARLIIGALLIKHKMNLSDEEAILLLSVVDGAAMVGGIWNLGKLGWKAVPRILSMGKKEAAAEGIQLWTSTSKMSSVKNAFGHWKKHGTEFPEFINAKQYVEGAKNFMHNSPAGTLIKTRVNGDILKYHPGTNTFLVLWTHQEFQELCLDLRMV